LAFKHNNLVQLWSGLQAVGDLFDEVSDAIDECAEEHSEEIDSVTYYLNHINEIHAPIWSEASNLGWFPHKYVTLDFEGKVLEGQDELNEYMAEEVSDSLKEIHTDLVKNYPERAHIIDMAFRLHKDGNYIACIPLFLAQTDGICAQQTKSFLFSDHDKRNEFIRDILKSQPKNAVILAPMLQSTQFGASISKKSESHKKRAPNRNGILHGSRKHLDYGTDINSLKCISLLAYISTVFLYLR
jgi:hypothetical protein